MKWLTNHYMPKDPSFKIDPYERGVSRREQILWEREWLKDKIIGRPKATDAYTVEQLEEMEYVGVYAREDE